MSAPITYHTDQHTEFKVELVRRGLSQRRIARELGITVQYLHDILRSRRKAFHIRERLVSEFHIPPNLIQYQPPQKGV